MADLMAVAALVFLGTPAVLIGIEEYRELRWRKYQETHHGIRRL